MDRHFALPVAFAAAVHAALLFGFEKSPRAPAVAPGRSTIIGPCPIVLEPEPVVAVETEAGPPEPKPAIEIPLPQSAEPLQLDPGPGITMPIPPLRPLVRADPTVIVPGSFGPFHDDGKSGGIGGPVPPQFLDNPPRARLQGAPVYPFGAKQQGLCGNVVVEFLVDETGRVHDPRVVSSSDRTFEEPTLRAVAKWRFEPGRRDGRVVRFKMAVPVVFNLNE
ncbi:MAG: energy transducer TonB [Opitutus sp.]|nr:energy transducer TonB [Opitutus sp.]